MNRMIAVCLGLVVLAACANPYHVKETDETRFYYNSYAGPPIDRFVSMSGIRNWESVGKDLVVLWTGVNEAYLVTVWSCPELRFAHTIRVDAAMTRSVSRSDKIIVDDDVCPIKEIRQLDVLRMKADKAAAREQKKT